MAVLPFVPRPSKRLPVEVHRVASPSEDRTAPADNTGGIIAFILERYHKVHREELPGLVELAREFERTQKNRPEALRGFADFLEEMAESLEAHMQMEERILFPMFARGGGPMGRQTIETLRAQHDTHDYKLEVLEEYIQALRPPKGASAWWRALYGGVSKFARDLAGHIRIENEVLFPRFHS
jgi:regulator of cell morphogenesis and NO signaling